MTSVAQRGHDVPEAVSVQPDQQPDEFLGGSGGHGVARSQQAEDLFYPVAGLLDPGH